MRRSTPVFFFALIGSAAGCGRPPHLVDGPIDVTQSPTIVRFVQPAPSHGEYWELCFEFERPGGSHSAAAIHATLLSSSGSRAVISPLTLDRRGESTVCQFGPVARAQPESRATAYEALEIYSDVPLRLRGIRGRSRS